ncbi:MAG: hypothetical protein QOF77_1292 [Solirubrobacteraceae bacterium]|nr:hypothetical protein [Solirubrobacteraceae bacterium]
MLAHLVAHSRRVAVLVLVTLVAVVIEVIQHESALKILLSAWLPALLLAVLWTRGGWPQWLTPRRETTAR